MVELGYVKKRKRKKAIGIISAVASAGMSTLILVSFLGRFVGSFTISLNTGNVKLTLSDKQSSSSTSTFLKVDSLPPFGQASFLQMFGNQIDGIEQEKLRVLDSDAYTYADDALNAVNLDPKNPDLIRSINFFKYTFFVKNVGSVTAEYYMQVKIAESTPSTDGRYLDPCLRVAVFQNNAYSDEHNFTVYAKESDEAYQDEEGNPTYRTPISYSYNQAVEYGIYFPGFAEPFEDSKTIATIPVKKFGFDSVIRYTIVTWIEGNDFDTSDRAPVGATLKLGVEINAYEDKE